MVNNETLDIHSLPAQILEAKRNLFEAKLQLRNARENVDHIRRRHGAQAIAESTESDKPAYPDRKARSLTVGIRLQADSEYLAARAVEDERERAKVEAGARLQYLHQRFEILL